MSKQAAVRLEDETYARLKTLSSQTGRTATFYIREAIEMHLDDLEDIYLAEKTLEQVQRGKQRTYKLSEVERSLDLAD